ncbi:10116_t:CDS:2, partial [Acaulospora colombiana]
LLEAFRPGYGEEDVRGHARIHLNVERWRVAESWFCPGIAGVDCAGLGEAVQFVLTPAQLPGLATRIHGTIQEVLETGAEINVRRAADPTLDAWNGMAKFSQTPEFDQATISRAFYDENGPERIVRWWGGNW